MLDYLAPRFLAVRHPDHVTPHPDHRARGQCLLTDHGPSPCHIAEPRVVVVRFHALATSWLADLARARSRAAAMRPANSGRGLVGRDRNSGCAWVATKKGCSSGRISTNSTSRPSGERPEQISPAASSAS